MNQIKMKESYLKFLQEPRVQYDGVLKPLVKNQLKWSRIENKSKNNSFIDLEEVLMSDSDKKVWIWSDHHFNHLKVIEYSKRPFKDVNEMNAALISNYKETVSEGDICIFVGDLYFKSDEDFKRDISHHFNKTYNIFIVGNHDFKKKEVKDIDFDEIHLLLDFYLNNERIIITHYPFYLENFEFKNIHGHIHNNKSPKENQINVSVEVVDYRPIELINILKILK